VIHEEQGVAMEEDGGRTLINKRPNLVLQYIEHDKPEVLFCGTLLRIFSPLLGLPFFFCNFSSSSVSSLYSSFSFLSLLWVCHYGDEVIKDELSKL
jgi:hypothetical protein